MTTLNPIPRELKNAFWKVVEECLVAFHDFSKEGARARSLEYRAEIESPLEALVEKYGNRSDVFYHDEPFNIACRIAGHDLDLESLYWTYRKIINKYERDLEQV